MRDRLPDSRLGLWGAASREGATRGMEEPGHWVVGRFHFNFSWFASSLELLQRLIYKPVPRMLGQHLQIQQPQFQPIPKMFNHRDQSRPKASSQMSRGCCPRARSQCVKSVWGEGEEIGRRSPWQGAREARAEPGASKGVWPGDLRVSCFH